MKALTVVPLERDSAELTEMDEPTLTDRDALLVELVCVGVCGTDREILAGQYGEAPQGSRRLVLGHESLGRVLAAPSGSSWKVGRSGSGHRGRLRPSNCLSRHCDARRWRRHASKSGVTDALPVP